MCGREVYPRYGLESKNFEACGNSVQRGGREGRNKTCCCLQVWEVATRKLKLDLPGHGDEVFSVDWSPDGASVASGGKDQVLRLWRH